jgi:hypothetical protein
LATVSAEAPSGTATSTWARLISCWASDWRASCSCRNWSISRSLTLARGSTSRSRTRQQQLGAVVTQLLHRHAVLGQAAAQFGHAELVLARDVLLGHVDRAFLDLQALLGGQLHLGLLADHALQHQAIELGRGRRRAALLRDLLQGARGAHTSLLVMGSELTTATM